MGRQLPACLALIDAYNTHIHVIANTDDTVCKRGMGYCEFGVFEGKVNNVCADVMCRCVGV
jgi:hypothetical protein